MSRRARRVLYQNRILLGVLLAALPAWVVALAFVVNSELAGAVAWSIVVLVTLCMVGGAFAIRRRVMVPLQSLANLLEALREGDYSLRGRNVNPVDAVGEVMVEVNMLSRTLHRQRLEALEAGVLLQKVIGEIDMAVFAFDGERRLRLVNRAGATLMAEPADFLIGRNAASLGLGRLLDEPSGRIVSRVFPGGSGRWEIRRRSFREEG